MAKKDKDKDKKKKDKGRKKDKGVRLEQGPSRDLDDLPSLAPAESHGTYSDGHPLDEVHYLECKLILKPDNFTSVKSFKQCSEQVRRAADDEKVGFDTSMFAGQRPQIREVIFLDTPDFQLYNNAFILRRRVTYDNGFPVGDPEVVFKFRHPDLQAAAEMDVRPSLPGQHIMKFKAEALPLKDRLGGFRLLYSHNVEFPMASASNSTAMREVVQGLPALQALAISGDQHLALVNQMIVEEVLLDLGVLDFGRGVTAKANAALWRSRGDHRPLVGEFSFQCKFRRRDELHDKAMRRCQKFFVTLQDQIKDMISLTTTKTGMVYRAQGNAPAAHE